MTSTTFDQANSETFDQANSNKSDQGNSEKPKHVNYINPNISDKVKSDLIDQLNLYLYQENQDSEFFCIDLMVPSEAEEFRKSMKEGGRLLPLDPNPISKEKMDKILSKHTPKRCAMPPLINSPCCQELDYSNSGIVPPPCLANMKSKYDDPLFAELFGAKPRRAWYGVVQNGKVRILWKYTEEEVRIIAKNMGFERVYVVNPVSMEVQFETGDEDHFDPIEEIKKKYTDACKQSNNTTNERKKTNQKINTDSTNAKAVPSKSMIAYVMRFKIRCDALDLIKISDEFGLDLKDYEIGYFIGTSASTVYRVRQIYNEKKGNATYEDLGEFKRGRKKNPFLKIPKEIYNHLVEVLQDKVPLEKDIKGYTWRASEVLRYLKQLGIEVSLPYFYKFCQKVGITSKVATRKNPKQDDSLVAFFTTQGFMEIARRAIRENREIVYMDQAAAMINHHNLRGLSQRGTPTMGAYSTELGHLVCSICTFIGLNGFFRTFAVEGTITSDDVIDMMEIIHKENPGKKFIFIIDNAGIHTSNKFMDWYEFEQKFCLVYYLPPYAPKLNVVEFFNNVFKQELRDVASLNRQELFERVRLICKKYNAKEPERMKKVKSLFLKKECRYAKEIYDQVCATVELKSASVA